MIVVADASPIHYLVLIEAADVLQGLYGHVLLPETVARELRDERAPQIVQAWLTGLPAWCEIRPDPISGAPLNELLDPGECAAIALAQSVSADRVLIDDWEGRVEALRRNLRVIGTLGVLAEAHQRHLLDFDSALGARAYEFLSLCRARVRVAATLIRLRVKRKMARIPELNVLIC